MFHKLNDRTGCNKFISMAGHTPHDREVCLHRLAQWRGRALEYDRQRHHIGFSPTLGECAPWEDLPVARIKDGPIGPVRTDEELDVVVAEAGRANPPPAPLADVPVAGGAAVLHVRGRGRGVVGRGRGSAKAKGRGRAHGLGRGAAASSSASSRSSSDGSSSSCYGLDPD